MANIEDRVVAMSFENSKFESGARNTISTLNKLNEALKHTSSGKGLTDINASAQKVNLSHIGNSLDAIRGKLGALNVAAVAIFTNIAMKAASAAYRMVKSFTVSPIIDGLHEYQTNLNAVQTILANTQASGAKLKDVNKALNELNRYSDKTIYNFSEMAKNIGTFTAAGVDLKTSTAAIKGIANLAAVSGSNSQQASTAMYQLSQAIAAGRVSLQDWNSVVNAGMGGTVFQRALAQTAEKMGTLSDGAVELKGKMKNVTIGGKSFRESITAKPGEKSWLTSDVLTKTLSHFTGDLTDAQLAAEGFNKAEVAAIQKQAKTAQNAATQVKTLKQVLDVARESAGSGWANTWQIIFGNFGEAKTTFTALSNAVNGFINANSKARNKVLKDWKALGGRTVLINGLKDAFHALASVAATVTDAFRDIFPPKTGKDLYDLTVRFREFAKAMEPSSQTRVNLVKTFRGIFAVLDIGKQIIAGIITAFGSLFKSIGVGSGGFLNFTGNIGDWLVSVDEALKKGNALHNFFEKLGKIIAAPIKFIGLLKDAIVALFTGIDTSKISDGLHKVTDGLSPMQKIADGARRAWEKFLGALGRVHEAFKPLVASIKNSFNNLGPILANAVQNINLDEAVKVIALGFFAAFTLTFKKFATGGFDKVIGKGLLGAITGSFKNLGYAFGGLGKALHGLGGLLGGITGNLEAMQQKTKAEALKQIAIALALLAASALLLSFIPEKKLQSALGGLAIGLGELVGSMALLNKIGVGLGFLRLPVLASGLVILSGAIGILTISVLGLSMLKWNNLVKGLTGVGTLLAALVLAAKPLTANAPGLLVAGVALNAIAVAMNILSLAVNTFGNMDMGKLSKGIGAVGASLLIIGGAIRVFPKGSIIIGIGLNAIATALLLISKAVEKFGGFDWGTIAKGLAGIGGSLLVIGGAMRLMPNDMIKQSIALGILGVALQGIAHAVSDFGGMSLGTIAKGLLALGGSLIILSIALDHMKGTIRGAAALTVTALGLRLLVPALKTLGKMSWGEIGKGMLTLAGAIALLGVAGLALEPVGPALLGFGVALLAIGGGMALAGVGVALIGTGLSAIAVSGPAAVKILVSAFVQLTAALPKVAKSIVLGLLGIVQEIAKVAPKFVAALISIGKEMINAIIKLSPEMAKAATALIKALIEVLAKNAGPLIEAGFKLLMDVLQGIEKNIGGVVKAVGNIIIKFLDALASKTPQIVTAGANVLIKFLQGIANNLAKIVSAVGNIIIKFIGALGDNAKKILDAGGNLVVKIVEGFTNNIKKIVDAGANSVVKFTQGIASNFKKIIDAGVTMAGKLIKSVGDAMLDLVDVGAKAVIKFLNGIAGAITKYGPDLIKAGAHIAAAVVVGIGKGLVSLPIELAKHLVGPFKDAWDEVTSWFEDNTVDQIKPIHLDLPIIEIIPNVVGKRQNPGKGKSQATVGFIEKNQKDFSNAMADSAASAGNDIVNWGTTVTAQSIQTFKAVAADHTKSKVILDITQSINKEFAKGIRDSSKIDQAFGDLKNKLNDQISILQQKKDAQQKIVNHLTAQHKPHAAATALLNKDKEVLVALRLAHLELLKGLANDKGDLRDLVNEYDKTVNRLDNAKKKLTDAKNALADSFASIYSQFNAIPQIQFTDADGNPVDPATQLNNFKAQLAQSGAQAGQFATTMQKLSDLGLNNDLYNFLVAAGPAAEQFAEQLLAGGKAAVTSLNDTDKGLETAATTMATNVSNKLYLGGVISAQALVNGLIDGTKDEKGTKALMKEINQLADSMIKKLKDKLKIKSPSEEFAKIGRFSTQGLATGLRTSSKAVTDAASEVGEGALTAMQDTMSRMSEVMDSVIDLDPTIRPVLDLSQFHRDARKMGIVTTGLSAGQAFAISSSQVDGSNSDNAPNDGGGGVFTFEQNNYSPKALSSAEIYRQTNNQLSQAKTALGLA